MSNHDFVMKSSRMTMSLSMQVDGKYEDWMEVLRLVYYSGELTG